MTILGISCQKDDGPFLVEWIAHHLAAGVDRMLVLSHDCADGSDVLLQALSQDDRVVHLPFKPDGKKAVQWQALKIASRHPLYNSSDWAMFFDCDEFVCLPDGTLPGTISQMEETAGHFDALALPWLFFGSGGQSRRGDVVTPERFVQAAPEDLHFPLGHLFKTLHRPKAFQRLGVHRPRSKPSKPARWLGPDGNPLPKVFAENDSAISLYGQCHDKRRVWLNHYSLRSREEFLIKRMRGLPNHMDHKPGVTYWVERNWNVVEDTRIFPMMGKTHDMIARLMALPGVAEAHSASLAWHRSAYETLQNDLDAMRLEFRLGFLPCSAAPTLQEGRTYAARQSILLSRTEK